LNDSIRRSESARASIASIQKQQARAMMSRVLRHWAAAIKVLQAGVEKVGIFTDGTDSLFGSRGSLQRGTSSKVSGLVSVLPIHRSALILVSVLPTD
jgi:hypothetical protein